MANVLSVLVVEDEPLIGMLLEDMVDSLGHAVVACVDCVEDALARIEEGGIDVAILDIHLREGAPVWPVADSLSDRGIPFLLASGDQLEAPPERHAGAPVLPKPFTIDEVRSALERMQKFA